MSHHHPPRWPHGRPPWINHSRPKRRFLLFRFLFFLGPLFLLFLLAILTIIGLVWGPHDGSFPRPGIFMPIFCGIPLGFTFLVFLLGGVMFRRLGMPLVEVMAAADAVAEGDLSVRVQENRPGEFGRLARSFNRMTGELARSEQQRRNLTADVAHELRTPLHIIQGNLEGILDGVYEATPEHITATLDETRLLARLVNDLQTLSLAEAGQLPLYPVPTRVADLLADVQTSFAGQAAAANVVLVVELLPGAEKLEITVDADRVEQVLANLVANALRHTPERGRVTLSAQPLDDGVRLIVQDNGSGIAAADLPYIFDRFWRGEKARTRHDGAGSGLGLAIARQLVQAHGGHIQAESQLNQGTTFTIDLPHTVAISHL